MSLLNTIKVDFDTNRNNTKGLFIVVCFRLANHISLNKSFLIRLLGYPIVLFYKFFITWVLGIEIPCITRIGVGFNLAHGIAVVVNQDTIIGDYVLLRQFTTIGNKGPGSNECPIIGNNVEIGANSVIIGKITIGDNVIIGAGTIITKSIPANSIVYGNPLKIKNRNELEDKSVFNLPFANNQYVIND